MKRLLSGCVAALTLLSATPARANHPIPLKTPPIASPYRCNSAAPTINPISETPFGVIWLDGKGYYDSIKNGGGQYYFDSSTSYVYFTSGKLMGWVAVYEIDEYSKVNRRLRFPHNKLNIPTKKTIDDHYNTADWSCFRKSPQDEIPPSQTR
jgi:hypothetical protein